MLIALSGTHSTGKSTLIHALKMQEKFKDYTFVDSCTRHLKSNGFMINQQGNNQTQRMVMDWHVKQLFHDNAVLDRCLLDGLAYSQFLHNHKQIDDETLDYVIDTFEEGYHHYDKIFYLKPEFDLVEDDVRSTDVDFQLGVQQLFEEFISFYNLPVITLTGTTEERVKQLLEQL